MCTHGVIADADDGAVIGVWDFIIGFEFWRWGLNLVLLNLFLLILLNLVCLK